MNKAWLPGEFLMPTRFVFLKPSHPECVNRLYLKSSLVEKRLQAESSVRCSKLGTASGLSSLLLPEASSSHNKTHAVEPVLKCEFQDGRCPGQKQILPFLTRQYGTHSQETAQTSEVLPRAGEHCGSPQPASPAEETRKAFCNK